MKVGAGAVAAAFVAVGNLCPTTVELLSTTAVVYCRRQMSTQINGNAGTVPMHCVYNQLTLHHHLDAVLGYMLLSDWEGWMCSKCCTEYLVQDCAVSAPASC